MFPPQSRLHLLQDFLMAVLEARRRHGFIRISVWEIHFKCREVANGDTASRLLLRCIWSTCDVE